MQVPGNEDDVLDVIRIDITPERIPLRLVSRPTVRELSGGICNYGGKDDFPDGG